MNDPNRRTVVLLGIGHTNAHVVKQWKTAAPPDTDLVCISDFPVATYSGMLPAVLAGQFPTERMQIDLPALCRHVGASLILEPVVGIDHARRQLLFADRPPVRFDVLAIGIGSTSTPIEADVDGHSLVEIKPMQTFLPRIQAAVRRAKQQRSVDPLRVLIVGGGVAGIEIAFCLPPLLRREQIASHQIQIVNRGEQLAPELTSRARRLVHREQQRRSIGVITHRAVTVVHGDHVVLDDGRKIDADLVLWAAGAAPPPLVSRLELATDQRGFIATDDTLQSISAEGVFSVGDTGSQIDRNVPKAGVYAVRQGPVLWDNLQSHLQGKPLRRYIPQSSYLMLMNLGDGRAIGQYKGIAFCGRWAMHLKNWIDRRFVAQYQIDHQA